jgi:cytoskeletal protein CcmA (bactofilin family)
VAGNATLTGTAGSGTVNVAGGDLVLSSAGRLAATADVTVSSSRTLTLGGDEIVDTLTLGGTLAGSGHMLTAGTTTLQTDAVVDANLGGGTLLVSGNARLSGTAGSGTVTVLGGELTLSSPGRLAAGADVTVQAGGALTLAGNETVSLFTSAGTLGGSGTLTASSYVLGGGTVNANLGTGTLSVTGDSFLAGTSLATLVNLDSGTLTLAGPERLADGAALALLGPARLTLGGDETVASLNSAGQINGSGSVRAASYTLTGGVVDAGLGAGALSVDGSTVINGQIETGSVDLISGTLTLGSVGRLAVQPELLVRSAATLRLGGAETVSSLAGAGAVDPAVTHAGHAGGV